MVLDSRLRCQVAAVRHRCAEGTTLADAARQSENLPAALRLALIHTPEGRLPEELAALHDFYTDQANTAAQRATFTWQVITFVTMACITAGAVMAMFMPMIQLYQQMTGVFD
jgi:type II secretory pathway component PulF